MAATTMTYAWTSQQRAEQIKKLERQMRELKNKMDFMEILSNFWPLSNLESRMERLVRQMNMLNAQVERLSKPFQVSGFAR